MILAALEQAAALVEGKVTPRLSGLLDSIKDEKKVSLAVADPKLGIPILYRTSQGSHS
jgi:nucleolar protein 58